jgi:hypothetical protein
MFLNASWSFLQIEATWCLSIVFTSWCNLMFIGFFTSPHNLTLINYFYNLILVGQFVLLITIIVINSWINDSSWFLQLDVKIVKHFAGQYVFFTYHTIFHNTPLAYDLGKIHNFNLQLNVSYLKVESNVCFWIWFVLCKIWIAFEFFKFQHGSS